MLTEEIKQCIKKCVLCWLATASKDGEPNVSPKEVFTCFNDETIIIANIASPQTVKNIKINPKVCLSLVDILVQKGFQLKGDAAVVKNDFSGFNEMEEKLLAITKGKFPFKSITVIKPTKVKPIIAPSYLLYPETTEASQIENAKKAYGLE